MKPLLLHGYGTHISVTGRTLQIKHGSGGPTENHAPHQLPFDSIVLDSTTGSISFEALRFLAIHDIPMTLMRWNGTVLSTVLPRGPSHGKLRLAQATAYASKERRLRIARELIREKVAKTIELTEHLAQYYPVDLEAVKAAAAASMGNSLAEVRTYEGRVALAYWRQFASAIEVLWPKSGFRARRSPQRSWNNNAGDPTNALLNYGYALLESACRSAITTSGLLAEIGFLHEAAPSKLPLAYDLQEPFRWIVDLSVIETIRDARLDRRRDFIVTENYHVRLRPKAANALAERLAANMNRIVTLGGRRRSFQSIILDTTRKLSKHLLDARTSPRISYPFAVGGAGHVSTEIAWRIAKMTLAEASEVGISKAALYYIQQRIATGKPLKLYSKVWNRLQEKLGDAAPEPPTAGV